MISSYLYDICLSYDVCLPVWYLLNCVKSGQLYFVSPLVWCLPSCLISFFSLYVFLRTSGSFLIIFSSVAPHRGQPAAKYHLKWQPTWARSLRRFMGRKHGVGKKEPGGLAPCSICDAVIDPTPWQVPVYGESSWFLPVCQEGSTVPFSSCHRRWGGGRQQPCWVEGRNAGTGQEKPCWVFAHLLSPLETSCFRNCR